MAYLLCEGIPIGSKTCFHDLYVALYFYRIVESVKFRTQNGNVIPFSLTVKKLFNQTALY
jgi:hypothetical protein